MNWLDIVIIVILGLSIFIGLRAGVIRVAALLAGLLIGIVLAGEFAPSVSGSTAQILLFAGIVVGVLILATLIGRVLRGVVRMVFMGWLDSLAGAVLGILVGALICGAALVGLYRFVALPPDWDPGQVPAQIQEEVKEYREAHQVAAKVGNALEGSALVPYFADNIPPLLDLLPGDQFEPVKDYFHILEEQS